METNENLTPDELKKLKRKQYYEANKDKINAKKKEASKRWYEANKDKLTKKQNEYYNANKDKAKQYYEAIKDNPDYKQKNKQQNKQYYEANKEAIKIKQNERLKNRLKNDPVFKLKHNVRNLVRNAINGKGYKKLTKTELVLGCTFDEFKQHIENQFETWMTWDNYGLYNGELNYGWDYDHITPMKDGLTEMEVIKLNHYTNIRPLCSYTNRVLKKDKTQ